ncbi:MAG TPA: hypothetical protein VFR07_04960 [Mycobacteriales bacterium]|nr:hypothetical protein [Mycobacteriales bacterium]
MPAQDTDRRAAGTRQIGWGGALLVVGAVLAVLLVQAGASTFAAAGYLTAVAGIVLIGNGLLLRRRGR